MSLRCDGSSPILLTDLLEVTLFAFLGLKLGRNIVVSDQTISSDSPGCFI